MTAGNVACIFTQKACTKHGPNSSTNIQSAPELYIIRAIQQENFPELQDFKDGKAIPTSSPLCNLCPFLDSTRVMRVGRRLTQSQSLQYLDKHPVILPKNNHFTKILLCFFHERVAHHGRGMALAKMGSANYWVSGARSLMASLIHHCITCRLHRGKPDIPQMSTPPQERVTDSPSFSYCRVDCFGPFLVKVRRKELKCYGLMVTCLASKAVHLILDDMTSSAFINAIRIIIAIRGPFRELG